MDFDRWNRRWKFWHWATRTLVAAVVVLSAIALLGLFRILPVGGLGDVGMAAAGALLFGLVAGYCRNRARHAGAVVKVRLVNQIAETYDLMVAAQDMVGAFGSHLAGAFQEQTPQSRRLAAIIAGTYDELQGPEVRVGLRLLENTFRRYGGWEELDRWPDSEALLEAVKTWMSSAHDGKGLSPHLELTRPDGTIFRTRVAGSESAGD
ncbi:MULTISPECIES: hypothetical protein [Streptomyces]|uniref:hypothetical protein n=1 Tax=Streptomyces TaxID=1883 RepID=UPI0004AAB105|nr:MULTISPECIES: hypothetical protein [Streptomyces]